MKTARALWSSARPWGVVIVLAGELASRLWCGERRSSCLFLLNGYALPAGSSKSASSDVCSARRYLVRAPNPVLTLIHIIPGLLFRGAGGRCSFSQTVRRRPFGLATAAIGRIVCWRCGAW